MTTKKTEFIAPADAVSSNGAGPELQMVNDDDIDENNFIDPYTQLNMLGDDDEDVDDDDVPDPVSVKALTGKPKSYFRISPDPEFTTTGRVIEYEPPSGDDKEIYFVLRSLWKAELLEEDIRKVRFFLGVDQRMKPFIWPVKIADGGAGSSWATSAKEMAHKAMGEWIKIRGDRDLGMYVPRPPRIDLGTPIFPQDKTLNELLNLAYGQKFIISDLGHPVINKL